MGVAASLYFAQLDITDLRSIKDGQILHVYLAS